MGAPNAALLIDFDNVTMGIRSDLTRQLKDLLNSDIIKGKVAVQRAYADWRRYAQYIVPLSEASVDLIFAPAYGSSKKNATDIRLAIDALELVFTRPEIGTFILLSGDSDFSSLVLKLKEYGKYVVGVGMRESASDLLVQNCDEYYSYSSLTGLTKAGDEDVVAATNPWDLAERAVRQMADQSDVMRSDRLKQVMLEMEPSFDESELGFSKFNRFITEAASKNKLALRKLDNGQYEVQPFTGAADQRDSDDRRRGRGRGRRDSQREARDSRRSRPGRGDGGRASGDGAAQAASGRPEEIGSRQRDSQRPAPSPQSRERKTEDLRHGYELLRRAVREVAGEGGAARDSDIKRQILEIEPGWDESTIGFSKFSRFLRQAHDAEVIDLQKSGEGYYEARLTGSAADGADSGTSAGRGGRGRRDGQAPAPDSRAGAGDGSIGVEEPTPPAATRERGQRAGGRKQEESKTAAPERKTATESRQATESKQAPEPKQTTERQPAQESKQAREKAPQEKALQEKEPATESSPSAESKPTPEPGASVGTKATSQKSGAGAGAPSRGLGRGRSRRGGAEGPPPLLPGQAVGPAPSRGEEKPARETAGTGSAAEAQKEPRTQAGAPAASAGAEASADSTTVATDSESARPAPGAGADFDVEELGLPADRGAVIRYLSNSYQGVGQKTAETLIDTFGEAGVFHGLHSQPEKVREVLGSGRRTEGLLDAWQKDYRRRTTAGTGDGE